MQTLGHIRTAKRRGWDPNRSSLQILPQLVSPAAPFQAPTVIMDPQQPVYVPGERLTLKCSAPGGEAVTSYQFYNPRGERVFTETTSLPGGPWLVLTAETGKTGAYSCEYWAVRDGQTIYSARSQPVQVSVLDFPVAPSISVVSDPPGKSPVTIECSAPPGHMAKRYQFLRQGNVITSQPGTRLQLRQSDLDATGPYTCSYEINVSGRMIQSLPSAPLSIHLTGVPLPPLAPQIILDPPKRIYFQGEHVKLTCSVPGSEQVRGYRFYHQRGEQISELDEGAWLERTAMTGNTGAYSCAYWIIRSGQVILSGKSESVSITVTAPPLAPKLSLHPKLPVYLPGEKVTLNCSVPRGEEVAGFRFHQHRGDQTPEELPAASGGAQMELTTQRGNDGTYTCQYWRWEARQEIASENSNRITVSVSVPPAAPQLSVSPSHPSYIPGNSVTLTCSAPGGHTLSRIQFLEGQNLDSQASGPDPLNLSRALQLPPLTPSHSGAYSCGYWFLESGQEIPSRPSHPVRILVLVSPSTPELPPAPRLTLAPPHPVYVPGERVTLRCSAPWGEGVAGYRFYRQRGGLIADRVPEPTGGARLELRAETGTAGLYVCVYWTLHAGREVPSGESRPVSVSFLSPDTPGKPSVSLSPDYSAYVAGDRVEINCSAPSGASPVKYGLYENGKPLGSLLGNASYWQKDLQANGTRNATRSFACIYVELIQGRKVLSYASDPVSISVFPAPAAPSLQLIPPLPLYVTGETVTAECVVPAGPYILRAHLVLRDGETLREQLGPWFPLNITPSDSGTYQCRYSSELHRRHLRSPPSEPVPLSVTDPPPQPALSVDPPSGVVSEGLPLLITCTAPGDTSERRFHFYKDGAEIISGDTGPQISTTEPSTDSMNFSVFTVPWAGPNNTGEFSCGYEVNMSGRWIPSPRSQAVTITVTAWSLPVPLVAGCGGAATALALLLLLIYLCRKKTAGA
ncbi:basement membrane-specific heparan sulfate proteoglycan core protein-like [Malaclemys terrapin pileata]|uniref:basement membrane-specific heparan sulfate proteoglycan core protein-like n=1 Tax=Malaclemys terrapin pileata TaxID=2991368 RepID=UPI0023A80110|nr:basement membrane-specific heparan sulfate proteoglycan core protein-like [Malaclemys terrapin pileata]